MQLYVNLKALTALSFRGGRHTEQSETLSYVPGSSLLGALAAAQQSRRDDAREFAALFLQNRLRIGNLYPATFRKELESDEHAVLPIPLTARSCKRFNGFKFQDQDRRDKKAGVTDALVPLALFALSDETKPELLAPLDVHPETGQPLDRISGFFRHGLRAEQIGKPEAQRGLRTRTGINYRSGTAATSVLYSREVLSEQAQFWGSWWIEDALWETFEELIDDLSDDGLRVGNNRTRGFGRVQFQASPMPEETLQDLRQRLDAFTQLFKDAAHAAAIEAPAALYVPILCTSDVILYDSLMRSRLRLQAEDFAQVGVMDAKLIFHAASMRHIQGWSSLWGLPKTDDWAIGMGSVFLFALPTKDSDTYENLWKLQQQGFGARQAEGFGMVSVANRFHVELAGGRFR